MMQTLRDAWDKSLLYFPLLSMGLLALGTYWLVRSTPTSAGPAVERVVRHEPDYFMENFSVRTFDAEGQREIQEKTVARTAPEAQEEQRDHGRGHGDGAGQHIVHVHSFS